MIKITNITPPSPQQFMFAIEGMRNPKNSWHKTDSVITPSGDFLLGENDKMLMSRLSNAGSVHRKFMRMLQIGFRVEAPSFWWSEFDTYKVSTVRNSCSKMHKIEVKEFIPDMFSHEGIDDVGGDTLNTFNQLLDQLEWLRQMYNSTNEKKYWRALIELLPQGYNMIANVTFTYETARNIYQPDSRLHHKLMEWNVDYTNSFCDTLKSLPLSFLITGELDNVK